MKQITTTRGKILRDFGAQATEDEQTCASLRTRFHETDRADVWVLYSGESPIAIYGTTREGKRFRSALFWYSGFSAGIRYAVQSIVFSWGIAGYARISTEGVQNLSGVDLVAGMVRAEEMWALEDR